MQHGAKDKITKAREEYFRNHPFDPSKNASMSYDEDGIPSGFFTLPDMGELAVLSIKYGYEYLATVRTDEDMDEWLANVMCTLKDVDLAGVFFAQMLRNLAPMIGGVMDEHPARSNEMKSICADGWLKEF